MPVNVDKAVKLIKAFEGIEDGNPNTVNLDPYLCPAGYWTIGWGHVVIGPNGNMLRGISSKDLAYSMYKNGITIAEAEVLLKDDLRKFTTGVEKLLEVKLNNNQICALISFSFNVGLYAFSKSTLLKRINANKLSEVPEQFMRWTKSNGKVSAGLVRRRKAEVNLWHM